MTQDELRALGERWKACPGFRWRPGMMCEWERPRGAGGQQWMPSAARVVNLPMGPLPLTYCLVDPSSVHQGARPCLSDPATLGCLLADVREAWGDPDIFVKPNEDGDCEGWLCGAPLADPWFGNTEAEALVCAREAATPKEGDTK